MLDFQRKKQLSILVQIAMVDEEFDNSEREVIEKIATRYNASSEELDEIIQNPDIKDGLAPMSVADKMDFMIDCILVVVADQVVTSSEKYFAQQMAARMGFVPSVVEFLIENAHLSREEMKEELIGYFD